MIWLVAPRAGDELAKLPKRHRPPLDEAVRIRRYRTRGQLDFIAMFMVNCSPAVLARGRWDVPLRRHRSPAKVPGADAGGRRDRDPTTLPHARGTSSATGSGAELLTLTPAKHTVDRALPSSPRPSEAFVAENTKRPRKRWKRYGGRRVTDRQRRCSEGAHGTIFRRGRSRCRNV